jgi:phosphatidylglycerophosphate synthase
VSFLLDGIDGLVARLRDEITALGRILDPVTDKILMTTALVLIGSPAFSTFDPKPPVWYVLFIISRDILLLFGGFIIQFITGTVSVRTRFTGKLSTFLQMMVILWALFGFFPQVFFWIVVAATISSAFSIIFYIKDGINQL